MLDQARADAILKLNGYAYALAFEKALNLCGLSVAKIPSIRKDQLDFYRTCKSQKEVKPVVGEVLTILEPFGTKLWGPLGETEFKVLKQLVSNANEIRTTFSKKTMTNIFEVGGGTSDFEKKMMKRHANYEEDIVENFSERFKTSKHLFWYAVPMDVALVGRQYVSANVDKNLEKHVKTWAKDENFAVFSVSLRASKPVLIPFNATKARIDLAGLGYKEALDAIKLMPIPALDLANVNRFVKSNVPAQNNTSDTNKGDDNEKG